MLKVIEYDGNLKEIAQKLNNRKEEISIEVNNAVNDIINDIRKNGNQALINYCRKFDGYQIKDENDFVVSNQEKEEALKQVDQDYIRILDFLKFLTFFQSDFAICKFADTNFRTFCIEKRCNWFVKTCADFF